MIRKVKKDYYNKIEAKISRLTELEKKLAKLMLEPVKESYFSISHESIVEIESLLIKISRNDENKLLQPFADITEQLFGKHVGDFFNHLVKHIVEYPHSIGWERRPFRTVDKRVHIYKLVRKFCDLIKLYSNDFNLNEYLTKPNKDVSNDIISHMIAYELDNNNEIVYSALKDIIYGDNNTALLNTSMIRGIFYSHNRKAYSMLGELLIAAKLQEGLRQSIVENMDEGTLEATKYILKIIIENNFIRYSSVIRGLAVWTGMDLEAMNKRVAEKCIGYAYECLSDERLLDEWLRSEDVNKLYLSLWATAAKEEQDLYVKINYLMDRGKLYQKIVAQYLLTQSQNASVRFNIAKNNLEESDFELQYLIISNYVYECSFNYNYYHDFNNKKNIIRIYMEPSLKNKQERLRQFDILKEMLIKMPKREISISSRVFDWLKITYSTDLIARKMMYLIAYDMDNKMIEELVSIKDLISPDLRGLLLKHFIIYDKVDYQREFIFTSLTDKSMSIRKIALDKIENMKLRDIEVAKVEDILKLKTGSMRQGAIKILLNTDKNRLDISLNRLIKSKNELQRLGALEIINEINSEETLISKYGTFKNILSLITEPTPKEKILLDRLNGEEYAKENGFGLFESTSEVESTKECEGVNETRDNIFSSYTDGIKNLINGLWDKNANRNSEIMNLFVTPTDELKKFLLGLSDLIHENREYEYESHYYSGYRTTHLLGTKLDKFYFDTNNNAQGIEAYPLAEVWKAYIDKSELKERDIFELKFYLDMKIMHKYISGNIGFWNRKAYQCLDGWGKAYLSKTYPLKTIKDIYEFMEDLPYSSQVRTLIDAYFEEVNQKELFTISCKVLENIIQSVRDARLKEKGKVINILSSPWLNWIRKTIHDDSSFKLYFDLKYQIYEMGQYERCTFDIEEVTRAYVLKIIDHNEMIRELMLRKNSDNHIRELTDRKHDFINKNPDIKQIGEKVIKRILDIEIERGDLATEVSKLAMEIKYYQGIDYFVKILQNLDKETFVRGYIYSYGGNTTKKDALSHLLRVCYPREGDSEVTLRALLKDKKISEQRLLEAAMYAPQWIDIVADYLNWKGLRSAAWYFHAHINESFSAEKETIVAHYTPILPQEFNDGAFDMKWFIEAYQELRSKRFKVLYKCAKYISSGANHRRSQLFADAVLGNLKYEDVKKEVENKRNKDKLLCLSIMPMKRNVEKDTLERYEFFQKFLKESKKFGAQRRDSEGKVVSIALSNLARNAGYQDVVRLTWDMESKKLEEVMHYFEPKEIGDVIVKLVVNEDGRSDIKVIKNNKALKSIPSKYRKHEYINALKKIKREMNDQLSRARQELERSMIEESTFILKEINNLINNPVISPLIRNLVLKVGKQLGYFDSGTLRDIDGNSIIIKENDFIEIAHPVHLYESGKWSDYQRDLFARQIKQPFKQVFRELYLPNEDELANGIVSRRYAGHQIQPKRAVALLKNRSWTVSYEEGLQKVHYKNHIIAKIYALADWFSPSDIECPTLETIEFFNRKSYERLEIKEIPRIIFSEIMRDVDLVVSIAHVGGVDPEASLSTIEMRTVIVNESLRLMKINNVRLEGNYARIKGDIGEYSVHLGSGKVFQQAIGALNILPVHSGHRGRIFLPFMDEDPKTSEILSKIILLARDTKIKDPHILSQIRKIEL